MHIIYSQLSRVVIESPTTKLDSSARCLCLSVYLSNCESNDRSLPRTCKNTENVLRLLHGRKEI